MSNTVEVQPRKSVMSAAPNQCDPDTSGSEQEGPPNCLPHPPRHSGSVGPESQSLQHACFSPPHSTYHNVVTGIVVRTEFCFVLWMLQRGSKIKDGIKLLGPLFMKPSVDDTPLHCLLQHIPRETNERIMLCQERFATTSLDLRSFSGSIVSVQ